MTPRVPTIQLTIPSINSSNASGTKGITLTTWCVAEPELAHLSDSELSTLIKGVGPHPFQGLSPLQL